MAGLTPPPRGEWKDNNGQPIYFDGIDNTAYVTGKAKHSARDSWIYTDGETFLGMRYDVGGDPANPDLKIARRSRRTPGLDRPCLSAPWDRSTTLRWTRTRSTT